MNILLYFLHIYMGIVHPIATHLIAKSHSTYHTIADHLIANYPIANNLIATHFTNLINFNLF